MTLNPSLVGVAARLKLYRIHVSQCVSRTVLYSARYLSNVDSTYAIAFLPSSSGTETKTDKRGPRSSLEQENREDDTEGCAESRADEHRAEAVVPLLNS